jgi:hypothetical protein
LLIDDERSASSVEPNPNVHDIRSTSCANCHLAESAVGIGTGLFGFASATTFADARSLAYVSEAPTATNLHAFGYIGRNVSVMQRTANESVLVATRTETNLKAK